jgi:hypothetical protein
VQQIIRSEIRNHVTKRTATKVYWVSFENMTCSGCKSATQAVDGFVVSSFHFAVCHRDRSLFVMQ